jgi:hypothetical protein
VSSGSLSKIRDLTSLISDVKFSVDVVLPTPPGNSESRQR